jgi:diaminohydroxyphosphoribosylaminopyrimidine deaminase / 5-amino-6-(5-phosphoribosylamino)uracil reductase
MKTHEFYMKRCIELAKNGLGTTYPNPLVGSVIVHNGKIIGEGWHKKAGEPHAEVHAVNSVKDKSLLKEATIYVSLEPCSHFGKTPPCCDLIIANKIPNVVIGTIDPFAKVAGNGIKRLVESGKNVTIGILEDECNELNKRFFTFHQKKRPYVILKWAETANGFIAPISKTEKSPVWITNSYSRQLVHKWRTEEQAILVGTNTVLEDNPKLDARDFKGNNPFRVVWDKSNKITEKFHVKNEVIPTFFLTEIKNLTEKQNIYYKNTIFDTLLAKRTLDVLYEENIQSVIVEGGSQTLQTFIDANLWDEARVFVSENTFNQGVIAPKLPKNRILTSLLIKKDQLKLFRNYD